MHLLNKQEKLRDSRYERENIMLVSLDERSKAFSIVERIEEMDVQPVPLSRAWN